MSLGRLCFGLAYSNNVASVKESKFASFLRDQCFSLQAILEKERVHFYAEPLSSSPRFPFFSSTSGSVLLLIAIPITGLELLFSLCSKNLWFSPTSYCHTYHWAGITLLTLFKNLWISPTSYCHTYHWAGITLLTLFKKPLV